jgi:amidophosphoribosyltransferase
MKSSPEIDDKPRDHCGVIGVIGKKNVVREAFYALYAVQNRGFDSAGIAVKDHGNLMIVRDEGRVGEALGNNGERVLVFDSSIASGHVRNGTSKELSKHESAQPTLCDRLPIAFNHNGHFTNADWLAEKYGVSTERKTDSMIVADVIGRKTRLNGGDLETATIETLSEAQGAFSLVLMDSENDRLLASRDRHEIRPLSRGRRHDGTVVVASETNALNIVNAQFERDIAAGTLEIISNEGADTKIVKWAEADPNPCAFEYVYSAEMSSIMGGVVVNASRILAGRELAKEVPPPLNTDLVIPVPDSGRSAAHGYARQSDLPLEEAIQKNRNIPKALRTFQHDSPESIRDALAVKFNVVPGVLDGLVVVVVDDSAIRFNTTKQLTGQLYDAGAEEVHYRYASPEYRNPCNLGMDTPSPSELPASYMDQEELTKLSGAKSVGFLSVKGLRKAIGRGNLCEGCTTGVYPEFTGHESPLAAVA